jgi:hypothetical protein
MTDREQLIEEISERLKKIRKEAGSIDPMAVANELAIGYSIPVDEICAIVIKEANAAGVKHF